MSMHAELGVERLQVLLVQLEHILNVEYLYSTPDKSRSQCQTLPF